MKAAWLPWSSLRTAAVWGAFLWLILLAMQMPNLHSDDWARLLLQLAILVWVPLGLSLQNGIPEILNRLVFPAGLFTVAALQVSIGWLAAACVLPWLFVCAILFVSGIEKIATTRIDAPVFALAAARIFIIIGGLSILADRLGLEPLGFDPAIILLTAVHFHYAGFIFLLLLGLAAQHFQSTFFKTAAWMAVAAVPMTALGITLAQLRQSFLVETIAAGMVAIAGWLGALGYLRIVFTAKLPLAVRLCWAGMAFCLIFSMALSIGYALRSYFTLDILNIPEMRAWHGTANALGVAGLGLLAWLMVNPVKTS